MTVSGWISWTGDRAAELRSDGVERRAGMLPIETSRPAIQSRRMALNPVSRSPQTRTKPWKGIIVSHDINVLALVKGSERYIFLFDDAHKAETLRTLGKFASNPELSFTWYDAAVLSQKIRHAFTGPATLASRFDLPQPTENLDGDE